MSRRPPPLILVSNRGPVTFGPGEGQWREQTRGGGGLVTALLGLAELTPALWVSAAISDGDLAVAEEAGGGQLRAPGPRDRDAGPLRGDRPRDVQPVLQRGREPDALVHPALPVGPQQRAGRAPRGARRLGPRLPRRQPGVRRGGQPGARRGPGAHRDAPRLPPLHRSRGDPGGPPGRLPAPLRPHPVEPAGLLAHPAPAHPRGDPARPAGQRRDRLPHPQLRAQLPALLRGPARPPGRLRAPPGALGGPRGVGALLPDLGQRADVRAAGRLRRGRRGGGAHAAPPAPAPGGAGGPAPTSPRTRCAGSRRSTSSSTTTRSSARTSRSSRCCSPRARTWTSTSSTSPRSATW